MSVLKSVYLYTWVTRDKFWEIGHREKIGNKKSYKISIRLWRFILYHSGCLGIFIIRIFRRMQKKIILFYYLYFHAFSVQRIFLWADRTSYKVFVWLVSAFAVPLYKSIRHIESFSVVYFLIHIMGKISFYFLLLFALRVQKVRLKRLFYTRASVFRVHFFSRLSIRHDSYTQKIRVLLFLPDEV